MKPLARRLALPAFFLPAFCLAPLAIGDDAASSDAAPASEGGVARQVQALDHVDFQVREQALQKLIEAGPAAIEALAAAAAGEDLEIAWRAGEALENIALRGNDATLSQACAAIDKVAQDSHRFQPQTSAALRQRWRIARHEAAARRFRELGGEIQEPTQQQWTSYGGSGVILGGYSSGGFSSGTIVIDTDYSGVILTDIDSFDVPVYEVEVGEEAEAGEPSEDAPADEAATDEPVTDEPAIEEAVTDEPATEEAPVDAPADETPAEEAPADSVEVVTDIELSEELIDLSDTIILEGGDSDSLVLRSYISPSYVSPYGYPGPGGVWLPYRQVRLGENWKGGDEGLKLLSRLSGVGAVEINGIPLSRSAIDELAKMDELQTVTLNHVSFQRADLARLKQARPGVSVIAYGEAVLGVSGETRPEGGFVIIQVVPESGAQAAGLQVGDVITSVDGERLASFEELTHVIAPCKIDQRVKVAGIRGDQTFEVEATLGKREPQP